MQSNINIIKKGYKLEQKNAMFEIYNMRGLFSVTIKRAQKNLISFINWMLSFSKNKLMLKENILDSELSTIGYSFLL